MLTARFSTLHPNTFFAISHTESAVTLSITFLLSGTTNVVFSPSFLTPKNALVLNSSISVLVLESKCRVMPNPSLLALSLNLRTGA
jgi:hypothetical protein